MNIKVGQQTNRNIMTPLYIYTKTFHKCNSRFFPCDKGAQSFEDYGKEWVPICRLYILWGLKNEKRNKKRYAMLFQNDIII